MVSTWLVVRRMHPSPQVLGEVALAALLLVALAVNPHDAAPSTSNINWVGPPPRVQAAPVEQPLLGMTLAGMSNLAVLAGASGAAVKNAVIPTARPAELLIPSLNVHRPVEGVGVNRFGVMNLPVNGWNAGWLESGPVPGAPGDAVIEGHAGYPDQPMLFGKLGSLRPGDQIVVVLADSSRRLFLVVRTTSVPAGVAPPGLADPNGSPRLTLITCTGSFDATTFSYSRRLVVEASYAGRV